MKIANNNIEIPFSLLSLYDDILTDILIDNIFLSFKILKMDKENYQKKEVDTHEIVLQLRLLPAHGDFNWTCRKVIESLKTHPSSKQWFEELILSKTLEEQSWFEEHLKRYLAIYHFSAGFDIVQTNRYVEKTKEDQACLISNRQWKEGDILNCVTGFVAPLSEQEEVEVDGGKDFSVMFSNRKGRSCLFLGPARLVNHECKPNTEFISLGTSAVCIRAIRNIEIGEEITTFYSEDYFGPGNVECLCPNCQLKRLEKTAEITNPSETELENVTNTVDDKNRRQKGQQQNLNLISMMKKQLKEENTDDKEYLPCQYCKHEFTDKNRHLLMPIKYDDVCCRCWRHWEIYEGDWPNRLNQEAYRYNLAYCKYVTEDMDESKIFGVIPTAQNVLFKAVYVNPESSYWDTWWPALVVPKGIIEDYELRRIENEKYQRKNINIFLDPIEPLGKRRSSKPPPPTDDQKSMPKVEEGENEEYYVKYFEDNSYGLVALKEMRLFLPDDEPYCGWRFKKGEVYEKARAQRRALEYVETRNLPGEWLKESEAAAKYHEQTRQQEEEEEEKQRKAELRKQQRQLKQQQAKDGQQLGEGETVPIEGEVVIAEEQIISEGEDIAENLLQEVHAQKEEEEKVTINAQKDDVPETKGKRRSITAKSDVEKNNNDFNDSRSRRRSNRSQVDVEENIDDSNELTNRRRSNRARVDNDDDQNDDTYEPKSKRRSSKPRVNNEDEENDDTYKPGSRRRSSKKFSFENDQEKPKRRYNKRVSTEQDGKKKKIMKLEKPKPNEELPSKEIVEMQIEIPATENEQSVEIIVQPTVIDEVRTKIPIDILISPNQPVKEVKLTTYELPDLQPVKDVEMIIELPNQSEVVGVTTELPVEMTEQKVTLQTGKESEMNTEMTNELTEKKVDVDADIEMTTEKPVESTEHQVAVVVPIINIVPQPVVKEERTEEKEVGYDNDQPVKEVEMVAEQLPEEIVAKPVEVTAVDAVDFEKKDQPVNEVEMADGVPDVEMTSAVSAETIKQKPAEVTNELPIKMDEKMVAVVDIDDKENSMLCN